MRDAMDDADGRDVTASLAGDESAYARLLRRHEGAVAAQMAHFTRDRRELEELVQDVFVEAYLSLPTYRGDAPFLHWLRRIASRTGYRYWRGKAREKERRARLEQVRGAPREDMRPPEAAEYLFCVFERLPVRDRLVLTLMYFEGCSTEEIAARMGWSRTLVKVSAFRARQKLRKQMEEAGYGQQAEV